MGVCNHLVSTHNIPAGASTNLLAASDMLGDRFPIGKEIFHKFAKQYVFGVGPLTLTPADERVQFVAI